MHRFHTCTHRFHTCPRPRVPLILAVTLCALVAPAVAPAGADASRPPNPPALAEAGEGSGSLESAAAKAGETGRKVAMSLIALGFAIASIVLAFRRDFKEAAGIFAIGLVAILLATPAGVNVLHDTVNSLFGAS
ncbi:MAG TPA: hypothetical protein VK781_12030 [Solirubrobacteraceae bacterium]|jgi:hypothetical protein|nr:hypothetical protein [Solirubrobacteraceae bacterium]